MSAIRKVVIGVSAAMVVGGFAASIARADDGDDTSTGTSYAGGLTADYRNIGPFYRNIGPFYRNIGPF